MKFGIYIFMKNIKVAIIGSGPAGLGAAVYTARAQLEPKVFAGFKSGGQLMWTTDVENYPGFKEGIEGPQLIVDMMEQAQKFGTEILYEFVTAIDATATPFKLWTNLPDKVMPDAYEAAKPEELKAWQTEIKKTEPAYTADSIIISTGASSIMLGAKGEQEFLGRGVSTCAVCDAAFYKDKVVYVVGGGDSAMEDTLALTKFAKNITVIHRRDSFRASKIMQERVLNNEKVKVLWNTSITEVKGDKNVTSIIVETQGKTQELPADGVFIAIGHRPQTQVFDGVVALDAHGYVLTRQSFSKEGLEMAQAALNDKGLVAFPTMTSVEGIFAGGDNVDVRYKQAITAAGQGVMAALDAERWLEGN